MGLAWDGGDPVVGNVVDPDSAITVDPASLAIVNRTPSALVGQESLSTLALRPDGSLVVARVPGSGLDDEGRLAHGRTVGLWQHDEFTSFGDVAGLVPGDPARQAYAADAEGDVVVWAETSSVDLYQSPWRMFVWDGARPRLLARSEQVHPPGLPIVDGDSEPVISNGRAYWATSYPLVPNPAEGSTDWGMEVVSTPLTGENQPLRIEASGVSRPLPFGSGVLVSAFQTVPTEHVHDGLAVMDGAGTGGSASLVRASRTGTEIIESDTDGSRVALVVAHARGNAVVTLDTEARSATIFPGVRSRTASVAQCGPRTVWSFADGSGIDKQPVWLYDSDTQALTKIDVTGNYGAVYCAGDLIAWKSLSDPANALATTTVVDAP
ncbi:hypothetical protein ACFO3K_01845 [Cellulomonas algicola]|uniref:hypothetical protein n=1 Tax=Cellulomonas algicola TaxID=2071633 RepID=UPI001C3FEDA3|nr:hypothetical protein [Cellulomonas algicola]